MTSTRLRMWVPAVVGACVMVVLLGRHVDWTLQHHSPDMQDAAITSDGPAGAERRGAFYSDAEIATDQEDWSTKECSLMPFVGVMAIFDYIDTRTLPCDKPVMVGGQTHTHPGYFVGEKWVCMSPKFNIKFGDCLVYSFGIERDFTFDDDMDQRFNCKVDRYTNIVKMLGHENVVIDYLKVDVEGYELPMFLDILNNTPNLLKNVKQIGMEVHLKEERNKHYWKMFQQLECLGFKVWFSEMNPVRTMWYQVGGKTRSCCYEIVWARDRQW
ncbi:uncharacterized protein [Procambarus clarkii]|uniref:uncharacterized protein isoform X3 n=1 Tax=Procambarus clarkii TaxID=6728 RepID=UPI001E67043E|nr:uncharacterized protein LOC123774420 isoform X3 [Procambarus clarkii]